MTMKGASWRGRRVNDGGESHALSERERVMRLSLFQRALRGGFLVLFSGQCTRLALGEEPAPLPRYVETIREVSLSACHDSAESCRAFRGGSMRRPRTDAVLATIPRPVRHCRLKKKLPKPTRSSSRDECPSFPCVMHLVYRKAACSRRRRSAKDPGGGGGGSVVSAPAPPASRASTVPTSETSLGFDVGIIAKVRPYYPSRPALVPCTISPLARAKYAREWRVGSVPCLKM